MLWEPVKQKTYSRKSWIYRNGNLCESFVLLIQRYFVIVFCWPHCLKFNQTSLTCSWFSWFLANTLKRNNDFKMMNVAVYVLSVAGFYVLLNRKQASSYLRKLLETFSLLHINLWKTTSPLARLKKHTLTSNSEREQRWPLEVRDRHKLPS